ncbi:hypothetical protein BT93_B1104 [Corymbia citriodora subsp. variegata]|nr:hypothetical protein BT93_B1104 [Corymbia citriodora subsp. variegata]
MTVDGDFFDRRNLPLIGRTSRGESSSRRGRSCPLPYRSRSRVPPSSRGDVALSLDTAPAPAVLQGLRTKMNDLPARNHKEDNQRHRDGQIYPDREARNTHNPAVLRQTDNRAAAPPCTWANVAKTALMGYDLDYFEPIEVNDELVAYFPDEAVDAVGLWPECLVSYFVSKKLPFRLVKTALKHAWGSKLADIKADDKGFFFMRIPDANFRRSLLERGPLTVARVPLILQQWEPLLELKKHDHTKIPVWIRLRNIPFVLWSKRGIGGIASMIGKPLYVDQNTKQMKVLAYARVCVEIKATDVRRDTVKVFMKGTTREVSIEYEWRPTSCLRCGVFRHNCSPPVPRMQAKSVAPGGMQTVQEKPRGEHPSQPIQLDGDRRLTTDQIEAASKAKAPLNADIGLPPPLVEQTDKAEHWQIQPAARHALRHRAKKNIQRYNSVPPKKLVISPPPPPFEEQLVGICNTDIEVSPGTTSSADDIEESEGGSIYEDDSPDGGMD